MPRPTQATRNLTEAAVLNLNNLQTMKKLTHGSTFSGIGAPEIAAQMLGIENAFHCETNPFGRRVLDYWFPNAESYEDITKTDFRKWRGKITILTGGFPCQPFSYAGKRRGAEDDRYLWPSMLRCIEEIRPDWFVGENVAGITTMALPGEVSKMGGQADIFGQSDDFTRTEQHYVLDEICRNLEIADIPSNRLLFRLVPWGRPTDATESLLSRTTSEPTPVAQDFKNRGPNSQQKGLPEMAKFHTELLPTPRVSDIEGAPVNNVEYKDGHYSRTNAKGVRWGVKLKDVVESGLLPTPTTTIIKDQEMAEMVHPPPHELRPEERWRNFPTVSPVCRGDDGLSEVLDLDTISASKWRTETLKAYGNAIVVQVIYSIFQYINEIEQQNA